MKAPTTYMSRYTDECTGRTRYQGIHREAPICPEFDSPDRVDRAFDALRLKPSGLIWDGDAGQFVNA